MSPPSCHPPGVLFGASVLGTSGPHTWLSRRVLAAFNRRHAFDNLADSEQGLRDLLEASFQRVELETVGTIAIFAATGPRRGLGQPDRLKAGRSAPTATASTTVFAKALPRGLTGRPRRA